MVQAIIANFTQMLKKTSAGLGSFLSKFKIAALNRKFVNVIELFLQHVSSLYKLFKNEQARLSQVL